MLYVIVRTDDNKFVAKLGSTPSYTKDLIQAQVFDTRAEANATGVCGNERVVDVEQILKTGCIEGNY